MPPGGSFPRRAPVSEPFAAVQTVPTMRWRYRRRRRRGGVPSYRHPWCSLWTRRDESCARFPPSRARGPGAGAAPRTRLSANSLDVDASGRVYIADFAGNTVSIYDADGSLFAHLSIPAPAQIVALPHDQFAVRSANADRLIAIYDLQRQAAARIRRAGRPER